MSSDKYKAVLQFTQKEGSIKKQSKYFCYLLSHGVVISLKNCLYLLQNKPLIIKQTFIFPRISAWSATDYKLLPFLWLIFK